MIDVDTNYQTGNRIEIMRHDADELRDNWLRANGWVHTSATPGCVWMWRKGEFFCEVQTAERIQRICCIDAYCAAHPELGN